MQLIWLSTKGCNKKQEKQSEETNKSLELNLDTRTLKLSDKGITVMNVSRSLMESIDNMQEKVDIIRRKILDINKEMLKKLNMAEKSVLKIGQKIPKLKCKEDKENGTECRTVRQF